MDPAAATDVVIIGGGLAGLSAAVECANAGRSVLLAEQKPRLGGRAYSFRHPETGDEIDNGQHLMMGCYHATLRYLRLIGTEHLTELQHELTIPFRRAGRTPTLLRTLPLPAPLHVFAGLMRLRHLTPADRLGLVRVGLELLRRDPGNDPQLQSLTVAQWLGNLGQSENIKRSLWEIIAVGALNDAPERISAALFVTVLKAAFFGSRKHASLLIPRRGLSPVLIDGAEEFLRQRHGRILLNTTVDHVAVKDGSVASLALSNGETVYPRSVISAVPYFDIPKLFGSGEAIGVTGLDRFISSPIVTVHLWFDAHFVPEPLAALVDSPVHWVFNRSLITGKGESGLMSVALVISGAHAIAEMEKEEVVELACRELRRFYPLASAARVIHALTIKEKRATFSPSVGMENIRPPHRTKLRNLFLAGDWTDTKLPATIEGAVLSGRIAADEINRTF